MNESNESAIIQVLADRLTKQRLPRAISLREKINDGEILNEFDIVFLEEVFEDVKQIRPLIDNHPEWQSLAAKVMNIYTEIMQKAMENEKKINNSI